MSTTCGAPVRAYRLKILHLARRRVAHRISETGGGARADPVVNVDVTIGSQRGKGRRVVRHVGNPWTAVYEDDRRTTRGSRTRNVHSQPRSVR